MNLKPTALALIAALSSLSPSHQAFPLSMWQVSRKWWSTAPRAQLNLLKPLPKP